MHRLEKRLGAGSISLVLAFALLIVGIMLPSAASASSGTTNCGSIVKKIYSLNEGPPFYKAKVLVTQGNVPCSEARLIIWKALQPGGYWGGINGWHCDPKGNYDPFIEKCARGSGVGQEVIKSSKPKRCPSCHANRK